MSEMTMTERLAWWALARVVRRYKAGPVDGLWLPRYHLSKNLHLRLDGVMRKNWPDGDRDV